MGQMGKIRLFPLLFQNSLCHPAPGEAQSLPPLPPCTRKKHSLCPRCRPAPGEAQSLPPLPPCHGGSAVFALAVALPRGKHSLCPRCRPFWGEAQSLPPLLPCSNQLCVFTKKSYQQLTFTLCNCNCNRHVINLQ